MSAACASLLGRCAVRTALTHRVSVAASTRGALPAPSAAGNRARYSTRGGAVSRRLSVRLRAGNPKPYDEYDLTGMQEIDVEQYRYEPYEWDNPNPPIPPLTDEELKAKTKAWQRKYLLDEAVVSPTPQAHQQTLKTSFIRRGIGLHSGAPVTVRVRPAFAGEGRYFVLVPLGTIKEEMMQFDDDTEIDEEDRQDMLVEFYKMSLMDEEDRAKREQELFPGANFDLDQTKPAEAAVEGEAGEVRIPATLASVVSEPLKLCTRLAVGDATIATVEHLLSALEGLGVDNARVEVEEGAELPVLDGSAEGWTRGVRDAGVVAAVDASGAQLPRSVPKPPNTVMVSEGDSFVVFNPEAAPRLTYLVDFSAKAECIGRQQHTWALLEDGNYALELAKARTFTTLEDAEAAREAGLIKGGSPVNALIAEGSEYYNPPLRYENEPVRHKLLDLVGDLALLGVDGNGGLPVGHVLAYKAGHQLHVKFAKKLAESCGAVDYVDTIVKPPDGNIKDPDDMSWLEEALNERDPDEWDDDRRIEDYDPEVDGIWVRDESDPSKDYMIPPPIPSPEEAAKRLDRLPTEHDAY